MRRVSNRPALTRVATFEGQLWPPAHIWAELRPNMGSGRAEGAPPAHLRRTAQGPRRRFALEHPDPAVGEGALEDAPHDRAESRLVLDNGDGERRGRFPIEGVEPRDDVIPPPRGLLGEEAVEQVRVRVVGGPDPAAAGLVLRRADGLEDAARAEGDDGVGGRLAQPPQDGVGVERVRRLGGTEYDHVEGRWPVRGEE
jgi:hypothetical protein